METMHNNKLHKKHFEWVHMYRVVIKSRGPGIFPGY